MHIMLDYQAGKTGNSEGAETTRGSKVPHMVHCVQVVFGNLINHAFKSAELQSNFCQAISCCLVEDTVLKFYLNTFNISGKIML